MAWRIVVTIVLLLVFSFIRFLMPPQSLSGWFNVDNEFSETSGKVKVFSTYPFNHKAEITINVGTDNNVKEGAVVTVDGRFLLGKAVKIFSSYSVVQTIFDVSWKMPVRVGKTGVDALLIGGLEPRLTMIALNKPVSTGESIYSAGVGFPYGLEIGKIKDVIEEPTGIFKETTIELPYNFNELREVVIK
ncbi:MAG: rod shape-determining protein MreC [Patescibacteria group bacterium]